MATTVIFPGEPIPGLTLPATRIIHPSTGLYRESSSHPLISTVAGTLSQPPTKRKTTTLPQITTLNARYTPRSGDLVIAQIQGSSTDFFHLFITPHAPTAILPHLAFEGASKKTRPMLKVHDLVYAKVVSADRNAEVELTCVNAATGKAEPEGLGPIVGGMVFDITPRLAGRLLASQGLFVLEELGRRVQGGFEVAVGKNGRIWVDCSEAGVRGTCAVGRCLQETEERGLSDEEQKKLVGRVLKGLGLD